MCVAGGHCHCSRCVCKWRGQLITIFKRDGCHHCGEKRQGGGACVCSGGALPLQQVNAVEVVV